MATGFVFYSWGSSKVEDAHPTGFFTSDLQEVGVIHTLSQKGFFENLWRDLILIFESFERTYSLLDTYIFNNQSTIYIHCSESVSASCSPCPARSPAHPLVLFHHSLFPTSTSVPRVYTCSNSIWKKHILNILMLQISWKT